MINIAVLGYGTVGSGVVEIISGNRDNIKKRTGGKEISVKYVLDKKDFQVTQSKIRLSMTMM